MIENQDLDVETEGLRLDVLLSRSFPSSSRAFIREAIARGEVRVIRNGCQIKPVKGCRLNVGERIRIIRLLETKDNLVAPEIDKTAVSRLNTVFEDDWMLACDKPAGQPVQPLSYLENGTLMNAVVAKHPECRELGVALAAIGESPLMAGALHRIDADTSGLVLVARDFESYTSLRNQFSDQTVRKTYIALVEGSVAVGGTIESDLIHDPTLPFCRMIDARHNRLTHGQRANARPLHAVTEYRPIGRTCVENEERTLLEVTIYTGVTHQIRAQLALAGMHIVNDRLYGGFAVENQVGHCLHALAIAFKHPNSGLPTEIRTRLPNWAENVRTIF